MAEQANETQPKQLKSSSRILLETYGEQLGYTSGWGGCQNCTPHSDFGSGVRCCSPSLGELARLRRIALDNPDMLRRVKSLQGRTEVQQAQWWGKISAYGGTINEAFKRIGIR